MSDAKQTELRVHDDGVNVQVVSTVGTNDLNVIADVFADDFRADKIGHRQALDRATRIVLAVLCHDDLVAALRGLMWRFDDGNDADPNATELVSPDIDAARAALAKAETKP